MSGTYKKKGPGVSPALLVLVLQRLSQKQIMVACPVGQNGGIKHLATRTTFPRVKGTYEIIIFFCVHSTFAPRTFHGLSPLWQYYQMANELQLLHGLCQLSLPGDKNATRLELDLFFTDISIR
jgi:hypothetical protein